MEMSGRHQVVQDGEPCEEFNVLEGSPNAKPGNSVGREMVNVLIFEGHPSFLGTIKSIDAIEDARFPSPVGSDDGQHLSLSDIKTDPGEGSDTSKIQPNIIGSQFDWVFFFHYFCGDEGLI
jgi:hypothetical protein